MLPQSLKVPGKMLQSRDPSGRKAATRALPGENPVVALLAVKKVAFRKGLSGRWLSKKGVKVLKHGECKACIEL